MSENNLADKVSLLKLASTRRVGILQLARDLHVGPSRLIGLVAELREEGLLHAGEIHTRKVGRPRRTARTTALGLEYLRAYETLQLKPVKSRIADLRRAAADANYAQRLAARGISPHRLFLELNELAHEPRGTAF